MDLKRLEYFLLVCSTSSLTDAASLAEVSQPALSRQIKLLEDELGVSLFDRHSRGMVLSEAGMRLRPQAERLLRDAELIRSGLATETATPRGELRIGTVSCLRRFLVVPALVRFMTQYPNVHYRLVEGTSRSVRDLLMAGVIDLGILSSTEELESFNTKRVASESLFLIGPHESDLSTHKSTSVAAIAGLPLALTARPDGLRVIIDRAMARQNLSVAAKIEVETLQTAMDLIDIAKIYSIFPYCGIDRSLHDGKISASPIEKLHISWIVATVRGRYESRAAKLFVDGLIQESRRKIIGSEWHTAVSNSQPLLDHCFP
jgi:LysR family nitrogen assimilation transcriptional regulator